MALIPEGGHEVSQYELRAPSDVRSGVVVLEGDLLLAKITPCLENGKQGIVKRIPNGWGYATTEVFPIRTNEQLKIEFLNYYLLQRSVREALASKMEGTTGRQRLPKAVVIALAHPPPPA
jgi:type I restriction enzyme S subunit